MNAKMKVAFICTHNSCRSQMAEAICKSIAGDKLEAYSAGTQLKNEINPDAVRVIQRLYGVDMTKTQRPKQLSDIPPVDIVITMGCGVECPYLLCKYRADWGLADPTGKPEEEFLQTAQIIKNKICELIARTEAKE